MKCFLQDVVGVYVVCLVLAVSVAVSCAFALLYAVGELTLMVLFEMDLGFSLLVTLGWFAASAVSMYATFALVFINDEEGEEVGILTWRWCDDESTAKV